MAYRGSEKEREKSRRWRAAHPEAREKDRLRRALPTNREKARECSRLWRMANPEKLFQQNKRQRLKKYRITETDYDALLAKQGGGCAICDTKKPGGNRKFFPIDHDKATGKVRGLLCSIHNVGLGHFNHDPAQLLRAVDYLASPPASAMGL
jgi:hypothetical protein